MREHRKGPDRGFAHAPARRAEERETERAPERKPNEVVRELLAGAEQTLATIAEVWIPKLEAAQATKGDGQRPYQRRAAYELAAERIEAQFTSAARARALAVAHAKRHTFDAEAMLEDLDQKVEAARKQVKDAPKAPVRFERVPGEAAIATAIAMPPGVERNTELTLLFSELDQVSARALHRRLEPDEPDPEDELAKTFKRVTTARQDLFGILDGTRKVRIDPHKFIHPRKADASGSFGGGGFVPREESTATPSIPAVPAGSKAAGELVAAQSLAASPAVQRKGAVSRPPVQRNATGEAARTSEAAARRSPSARAASVHQSAPVPARGDYLVERTPDGSYVFVFNTFDRRSWSEPVFIGLRYYMQQAFPGVGDAVIRAVFANLKVRFEHHDSAALPDDHRYELQIDVKLHRNVVAWMAAHHPEWAPHAPKLGGGGLHQRDAGGDGKGAAHGVTPHEANPPGTTMTSAKDGDSTGALGGRASGKLGGGVAGTQDGDVRTTRDGGIKHGSIYGEPDGDAHGWHRWEPKGQLQLQPIQPTYIAGSSVEAELAWDLTVHPEAGQILLPNHCTYAWTVHRGGKLIDSDGRSVLADDRRARLHLGTEPGMYEIAVTATSRHFKVARQRFSSSIVVRAVSEQAFDRAAFDQTQLGGPDAAFSRDDQGALHLKPGQTARTTQDEIGSLDLTRGGIDALAAQGKITGSDHDVAASQIDKQRDALVEIQAQVQGGTPYIVRGSFVSREDSSTTTLRLLMHVLRRSESGGVARYELVLHDTTFGDAVQHPGCAAWRLDHDNPAAVYRRLEGEALDEMADHFHAHNDYPKGTVHLAAQRLASGAVWEKTLDTNNGRKTAKKILGTAALLGGAAMLIVPGGSVVATGLMVVTSGAGIASVALEVEGRIAQEGRLKLDRRLAMDVLQVVAISLPFGTLTKTFAGAKLIAKNRFLLCMTGLDVAQGFVIATTVKTQLAVIEANTAVQLAGATSDEQRKAIHGERDRRVAEVIGSAVVDSGFLLVSLGHGIKRAIAITRAGARFTVREPVRELVKQGRERLEQALSTDTFEHEGQRVQLTGEERRYLEHEIAAHDPAPQPKTTEIADSTSKPGAQREHADAVDAPKPSISQHEAQPPAAGHPADSATTGRPDESSGTGHGDTHTAPNNDVEAALGATMRPEEIKALSVELGDQGLVELAHATGERFPELVAEAGTAPVITSVKRFGAHATAKLLKGLGGQGLRRLSVDIDELAFQLDAEGAHGSYRWGGTGKAERALSGGGARVHKSADPAAGARTLDVETPAGPVKLEERGRYADVRIDRGMLSPGDAQRLEKLFADYGITEEKAKQLVLEALENARLAKNTPDLAAAIKKVWPTLDEAKTNANRATESDKPTTTQDVILMSGGAPLAPAAEGPAVTEAKSLIASGILEDRTFQSARTAPEGRDAVSQRLQALVAKDRAEQTHGKKGGRVMTRVEFKGDLFVDKTSAARYVDSGGNVMRETDVAPDLDLAYVVEKDGTLNIEYVGSVKIVKGSSAAAANADAANQNRLGKAAVEAQGKRFPTTTRNGAHVWAEVKSVIGHDETGAELDLTGKLRWDPSAKTETIGSRGTRGFDANLPASKSELDEIVVAIWRLAELRKR